MNALQLPNVRSNYSRGGHTRSGDSSQQKDFLSLGMCSMVEQCQTHLLCTKRGAKEELNRSWTQRVYACNVAHSSS